jgi:predicted thioredoxin/glutaredoxin
MAGKIEETEPEFQATDKIMECQTPTMPTRLIAYACASVAATEMVMLRASLVALGDTIRISIVHTSSQEGTKQLDLMTEIRVQLVDFVTEYREESLKSSQFTSTARMARELLTLFVYSEGRYASAQRQRLMKWHSTTGRK